MQIESLTREFKQQYTPEIVSTIISFANTLGGELYIGIADDSTVIGVDDPDAVALQVVNTIRDSIRPDITPFVRCENTIIDGKNVIHVTVKTGINRPYYLAGKGPKPSGVFVRQGPSTVSASPDAIVEMIKDARGETFESLPCFSQTFTFDKASA